MKILLFVTGYRQLKEYDLFCRFLKRLKTLPRHCDIFLHCNNPDISDEIVLHYRSFDQTNKYLHITTLNCGYNMGGAEAWSTVYDMRIFHKYDYVIQLNTDVFMTDDVYLMEVLHENLMNDTVFFITKSEPDDEKFFSFDFFIFKPKLLSNNIFSDELYTTSTTVIEHFFHDMIMKHDIKWKYIKRFNNDCWYPRRIDDHLKLYHEHDLDRVREVIARMTNQSSVSTVQETNPYIFST